MVAVWPARMLSEADALAVGFTDPPPREVHDARATLYLEALCQKHHVTGVSVAMLLPDRGGSGDGVVQTMCAGSARREGGGGADRDPGVAAAEVPMTSATWLQIASLSKTLGTAFALEVFAARGIDPATTRVNALLGTLGVDWRLEDDDALMMATATSCADAVTLAQLVNHTALGMHYVPGVPLSRDGGMPAARALLEGAHAEVVGISRRERGSLLFFACLRASARRAAGTPRRLRRRMRC